MNERLFPNALHVARREYLFRVRGRTFLITTALLAVAVAAMTLLPTILSTFGVGEPSEIAVHVDADNLTEDPVTAIQVVLAAGIDFGGGGEPDPDAEPSEPTATVTRTDDPEAAAEQVRSEELDGLLTITRNDDGDLAFEYLTDASPTSQTRVLVTQAATALTIADRLERAGVSEAESAGIFAPPDFNATAADPDDPRDEEDFGGAILLTYVVVILTFMAILTYGNWVAQSVAEEKSNRVMELLVTAATPRQLLTGKVLGTSAAGLTQYLVMILAVVIGFVANGPISSALGVAGELPFTLPELDPGWILAFTGFFLLGFVLYATLYAAAGSLVSRVDDVQQAVGPLIYLAMGGYFVSFFAMNMPEAGWVRLASFVPFFSPYLMPTRLLLTNVQGWEILLALVLLAFTVAGAIWIAARIYSAGVLMYGQRVGVRTIWKATRVAR
ncbi:MAG TPA: ABC transporter permease [Candidatus Limnocylindria bacterium]|nr:ABC transporter permease [Candidatus Limnocylindria bacterium]